MKEVSITSHESPKKEINYPSLNPNNWNRKKWKLAGVYKELLKEGYIRKYNGKIFYNSSKALSPKNFLKEVDNIKKSLLYFRSSNEFTANLPMLFPAVITLREIVPTDKIRELRELDEHRLHELWENILNNIPINAVPSTDKYPSFGISQMTRDTYIRLRKLFPSFLPKYFHNCISYSCQIKAAVLLTYSNLNIAWGFLKKRNAFMKLWGKAKLEDRRRFIVFLSALLLNAGWNKDMRSILTGVFVERASKIKNFDDAVSMMKVVADQKKPGNDSGSYATDVLKFYNFLSSHPLYFNYNVPMFLSSKIINMASRMEGINIQRGGILKAIKRKSKKTGNVYPCYIFTIDGMNKEWNKKMLKTLLKNPTQTNIRKILDFNGLKEEKGIIAIPQQFFNKGIIGEEFVVVENNKWNSYKEVVVALTNARTKEETERYRTILYAINNSHEARHLKKIRVPSKMLRFE